MRRENRDSPPRRENWDSPRRGYSLVELLVIMSVSSVLMAVAVGLLYGLMRSEVAGRSHVATGSALGRLAEQFRRDVHATPPDGIAILDEPAPGATIRLRAAPDRTIVYRAEGHSVERTEETADGTVSQRETFVLSDGAGAAFAALPTAEDGRATLAGEQPAVVRLTIAGLWERRRGADAPSGQPKAPALRAGDHAAEHDQPAGRATLPTAGDGRATLRIDAAPGRDGRFTGAVPPRPEGDAKGDAQ